MMTMTKIMTIIPKTKKDDDDDDDVNDDDADLTIRMTKTATATKTMTTVTLTRTTRTTLDMMNNSCPLPLARPPLERWLSVNNVFFVPFVFRFFPRSPFNGKAENDTGENRT